ncbi:MAG: vWA domain-containing protein, partial [Phycisphaerae bacterium]
VDIVAVVDVSKSMLARDLKPNRLERAKEEIRQQLTERAVFAQGHRLALMLFSGGTVTRLPLTTDHQAFREKLADVRVGTVRRGGTNIGYALEEATDLFARSPERATRIILLFTDGEDHEERGAAVAKLAYDESGIRVFPIGIGDPASTIGAQVPNADGGDKPMLHEGQIVFSKLDVEGLRNIADAGGGRYAPISNLNRVVDAIAKMRQSKLTTEERMRHRPRYQWFLTAALILMAIEIGISQKRVSTPQADERVWNLTNG